MVKGNSRQTTKVKDGKRFSSKSPKEEVADGMALKNAWILNKLVFEVRKRYILSER